MDSVSYQTPDIDLEEIFEIDSKGFYKSKYRGRFKYSKSVHMRKALARAMNQFYRRQESKMRKKYEKIKFQVVVYDIDLFYWMK